MPRPEFSLSRDRSPRRVSRARRSPNRLAATRSRQRGNPLVGAAQPVGEIARQILQKSNLQVRMLGREPVEIGDVRHAAARIRCARQSSRPTSSAPGPAEPARSPTRNSARSAPTCSLPAAPKDPRRRRQPGGGESTAAGPHQLRVRTLFEKVASMPRRSARHGGDPFRNSRPLH
jgi:hypothetical protein